MNKSKIFISNKDLVVVLNYDELSGHLFEAIDYYWFLKDYCDADLIIPTNLKDLFYKVLNLRYTIKIKDVHFCDPNLIRCKNILIVDGFFSYMRSQKYVGSVYSFGCKDSFEDSFKPGNIMFLEDHRVYTQSKKWNPNNSIHYVKKLNTDILKKPGSHKDATLFYIRRGCKTISNYSEIHQKYNNCIIVDAGSASSNSNIISFEDFNKFVYTPVDSKFDCSNRLLAECDYFNIDYEFLGCNYYDPGINIRMRDIKNKDYSLKEDDPILGILNLI